MPTDESERLPVFVGGCPRSGTTLLGAILGGHSDIVCVPESQFLVDTLLAVPAARELGDEHSAAVEHIVRHWRFDAWHIKESVLEDMPGAGLSSYGSVINGLVQMYASRVGKEEARVWVDHTPSHIRFAPLLLQHLPSARFVHLVRDSRAVAASVLPLPWGPNTAVSAGAWWMQMLSYGLFVEERYGPDAVVRVRYEDLLRQPEDTIGRLCRFIGVEAEPEMLMGTGFDVPGYTADQHELVGQPVQRHRAEAWQHTLRRRDAEMIEAITAMGLETLGYELRRNWAARPPGDRERLMQGGKEAWRGLVVNPIKNRRRRQYRPWCLGGKR